MFRGHTSSSRIKDEVAEWNTCVILGVNILATIDGDQGVTESPSVSRKVVSLHNNQPEFIEFYLDIAAVHSLKIQLKHINDNGIGLC